LGSIHSPLLTFAQGAVRNYELTLLGNDGQQIPVSFNATVYKDSDGVVQGVFAAARDIRERLAMVRQLEEAKNCARGLIDCCVDLMVTIDRDGIITDANRAAVSMTGWAAKTIVGASFKALFDDPRRAQAGVEQTFASGEVRNYDLNLVSQSCSTTPVSSPSPAREEPDRSVVERNGAGRGLQADEPSRARCLPRRLRTSKSRCCDVQAKPARKVIKGPYGPPHSRSKATLRPKLG
jgi:hypothetical protein